jgi:hypothetical protein
MPYIIETSTPRYHSAFGREVPHLTHTAVATLEEARKTIAPTILAASPNHVWHLAEAGGTVGPLPDGAVIEVRPIEPFALGLEAGLIAADHAQLWPVADLVERFNAR